ALVRAKGGIVSRDALVASCWGGLAVSDDAINRCIQQLRRLAENQLAGTYAIETLPRIGYRLSLTERAGDGAAAPRPAAPGPTAGWRRRWLAAATAAALLVALGAGVWVFQGRSKAPAAGAPPIAVLPFRASAGDPLERAFASGVADEVASALAKTDLKVFSRDLPADPAARETAAEKLGARFAIDGLVVRTGDHQLVLNVRLDDLPVHGLLWSAKFDRPETQAQTMQEQVAAKIAGVAQCALDVNGFNGGRTDDETVGLYLKACDLWDEPEGKAELGALLQQIVQREPRFAKGWARLALFSFNSSQDDDAVASPDLAAKFRHDAEEAVRRAQQLDPREPLVYATLYDLQPPNSAFRQREAILARGLSFKPDSPDLLGRKSYLLEQVGRMDEAVIAARRAMELDPLSPERTMEAAKVMAFDGDLSSARALAERALRLWPDLPDLWWGRLAIEAREGDTRQALKLLDGPPGPPAGPKNNPYWLNHWRGVILARQTRDPARIAAVVADRKYAMVHSKTAIGFSILDLEMIGATDAAFAVLNASRDLSGFPLDELFRSESEPMLRDPRFMPLAARLGLVDYWRSTDRWPDFCREPLHPYDCRTAAAAMSHPEAGIAPLVSRGAR
ncbi:MAG TPA: winged helix-turn-helix domain-containing protein, partial [Caulobacteraceae bacterium]|nr:winged helix-turn-helix domain-containing protein [Caulobacteraceae bacterium]